MCYPCINYQEPTFPSIAGTETNPASVYKISSEEHFQHFCRKDPNERFSNITSIKVLVNLTSSDENKQVHFLNTSVFDYHYAFVVQYLDEKR